MAKRFADSWPTDEVDQGRTTWPSTGPGMEVFHVLLARQLVDENGKWEALFWKDAGSLPASCLSAFRILLPELLLGREKHSRDSISLYVLFFYLAFMPKRSSLAAV